MRAAIILLIVIALVADSAMAGPKSKKRGKSRKSWKSRERPLRIELKHPDVKYVQPTVSVLPSTPVLVQQGPPYTYATYDNRPIAYTGDNRVLPAYSSDNRGYHDANGVFITPGYSNNGGQVVVYPNSQQYVPTVSLGPNGQQYVSQAPNGQQYVPQVPIGPNGQQYVPQGSQIVQPGPQYGPQGPQYGPQGGQYVPSPQQPQVVY